MKESVHLGHVAGTRVGFHWSLLPIFLLVTWSLAAVLLPFEAPGLAASLYWLAGILTAVAFFASLLAHELSHAAVARRRGMQVSGIVLWLFGGVAQLESDPADPRSELWMALAGPATSLAIAAAAGVVVSLLHAAGAGALLVTSVAWLAVVNAILGVFNLLPAFPLDGGRVLRAGLWRLWGDRQRATRTAAMAGRVIGFGLMALGAVALLTGRLLDGVWIGLIGWFVATAAGQQGDRVAIDASLEGIRVSEVMSPHPVVVPAGATVAEIVDDYVRPTRFSSFPIQHPSGRIVGLTTVDRMRKVPRDRWWVTPVTGAAAVPAEMVVCAPLDTLADVAARMDANPDRRAMVVDGGHVVGILAPSDISRALGRASLLGTPPSSPPTGPDPSPVRTAESRTA